MDEEGGNVKFGGCTGDAVKGLSLPLINWPRASCLYGNKADAGAEDGSRDGATLETALLKAVSAGEDTPDGVAHSAEEAVDDTEVLSGPTTVEAGDVAAEDIDDMLPSVVAGPMPALSAPPAPAPAIYEGAGEEGPWCTGDTA